MSTQEAQHAQRAPESRSGSAAAPVDVEQAEAALVEHYPRLVRIAYLVLPPSLGRNRRVLTAHALVQRSLPRRRLAGEDAAMPVQRRRPEDAVDPGYAYVRLRVLRQALDGAAPLRRTAWPKRAQLPPLLPQVWGLRLFPALRGRRRTGTGPAAVVRVGGRPGRVRAARPRTAGGRGGAAGAAAAGVADRRRRRRGGRRGRGGRGGRAALLEAPEFDPRSFAGPAERT